MLTAAEREKVYFTRGFRNFCFRAGKANPHYLYFRSVIIIYFCSVFLIAFAISKFKITWCTKLYFFICSSSIIIKYFWGTWLSVMYNKYSVLHEFIETKKQKEEMQKCISALPKEFLQKFIDREILVTDLGDGLAWYRKKKIIALFYKGLFYDMELYEKLRKVFLEPEIAIQQLNNNDNIPKE